VLSQHVYELQPYGIAERFGDRRHPLRLCARPDQQAMVALSARQISFIFAGLSAVILSTSDRNAGQDVSRAKDSYPNLRLDAKTEQIPGRGLRHSCRATRGRDSGGRNR
jgi:hypothetical protein